LTDIRLIGFSEGAGAIGKFLSMLADNPNIVPASVRQQLRAAVMLEAPTGTAASAYAYGFARSDVNDVPGNLARAGIDINLADIWNTASIVHGGQLKGWKAYSRSYDSRPWLERIGTWATGLVGQAYRVGRTSGYHENIIHNEYALTVMHDTCYE